MYSWHTPRSNSPTEIERGRGLQWVLVQLRGSGSLAHLEDAEARVAGNGRLQASHRLHAAPTAHERFGVPFVSVAELPPGYGSFV
jgi:hypothetical protein